MGTGADLQYDNDNENIKRTVPSKSAKHQVSGLFAFGIKIIIIIMIPGTDITLFILGSPRLINALTSWTSDLASGYQFVKYVYDTV